MPRGSSSKRERQYEHIKEGAEQRGASEGRAKEMAARTVNKERARSGSPGPRADLHRGHVALAARRPAVAHTGSQGPTRDQLYAEAKRRNIEGRSRINKSQLKKALGK